jgi:hypothetical protein
MKLAIPLVAALAALDFTAPIASGAEPSPSTRIAKAALAAAGRETTLKAIDYGWDYCDSEVTAGAWLKALVGRNARAITWTGGKCELVNNMHPGIDAAAWPYCAQATISLVHPKARGDQPMIEIYLEKPDHGRPGAAYAFRSLMMTRDDGPDYERFRKDFKAQWNERFPPDPGASRCQD